MKRDRYHDLCKLTYLFLILVSPCITFAAQKISPELIFDQNNNCTTKNGITLCRFISEKTDPALNGATIPGGVVDSRKNGDDMNVQRYTLAPNNGKSMLNSGINTKQLKTEIDSKALSSGANY